MQVPLPGPLRECLNQVVFFGIERLKLPLGHIVSWTSNHATYDVYSPKVVETLIHGHGFIEALDSKGMLNALKNVEIPLG